ncbi:MAG: 4-(cytidine 5'-diphospho)-2-C-methyl-D-erythritol kinase [Parachlamydiales bacterium]|nr:4-(cytidine 5'-diphospho)-2-C-methyl-D-erythritol kinase [Parachlamydiales bacterium]
MLKLFSPAKLNLFFRVLGKREDGFHELASLFQAIDFGDILHYSLSKDDVFTCSSNHIPLDDSNLVIRALKLFRQKTGIQACFKIHLEKYIPTEAGLGGGSSNAATTLWALNKLTGQPASLDDLIKWSADLGCDITFFLSEGTAYCRGRGEIIEPLPLIKSESCTLVKPDWGLSTASVFKNFDMSLSEFTDPDETLDQFLSGKPSYFNDLEEAANKTDERLSDLKQKLYECGFHTVTMTGTGSSFFCYGQGNAPKELFQKNIRFISRKPNQWYDLPRIILDNK